MVNSAAITRDASLGKLDQADITVNVREVRKKIQRRSGPSSDGMRPATTSTKYVDVDKVYVYVESAIDGQPLLHADDEMKWVRFINDGTEQEVMEHLRGLVLEESTPDGPGWEEWAEAKLKNKSFSRLYETTLFEEMARHASDSGRLDDDWDALVPEGYEGKRLHRKARFDDRVVYTNLPISDEGSVYFLKDSPGGRAIEAAKEVTPETVEKIKESIDEVGGSIGTEDWLYYVGGLAPPGADGDIYAEVVLKRSCVVLNDLPDLSYRVGTIYS